VNAIGPRALRCCSPLLSGLALLLALAACDPAPVQRVDSLVTPDGGPFASSQLKPHTDGGPAPLPLLPRVADRLQRQQAYFKALAGGQAGAKARTLGPTDKPLSAGSRDLRAGALPHLVLRLSRDQQVAIETRSLSSGADPVLHLLSLPGEQEVAFDDDSGSEPGGALIRYTSAEPANYLLLLRAYAGADDGTCDLTVDGQIRLHQVKFGGATLPVAGGRTLAAVLLNDDQTREPWPPSPRAARDTLLLLVNPTSGRLQALDDDSGVELGSLLTSGGPAATLAVLGALSGAAEGSARLVINDAATADSDGDGLGDGLEGALCLCATAKDKVCGFDCAAAATPQDSDGDGLSDAEETLGMDHALFPQLFPRWGADPRHRDLFVEVDPAGWTDDKVTPPVRRTGRPPTAAEAHLAAAVYAKLTDMRNPDGGRGIRLHMDVGHDCGRLSTGIDRVCGDFCALGPDGVRRCGQSDYLGPKQKKRDSLAPGRLRRFHLAVSDCAVAGSAPVYSDVLEFDCDRITAMVHELGHNLGLARHYGTPETGGGNCKPNYPSLMNYAYSDRFYGGKEPSFSDGSLKRVGDLDPRDLDETMPFGGDSADVGWLATRPFFYDLYDCKSPGVGCKVDWNRDGVISPSVRAIISPMPNYGWICENVHGNALDSENIDGLTAVGGPAAAEVLRRGSDGKLAPALHVIAPAAKSGGGAELHLNYTFKSHGGWAGWTRLAAPALPADAQPAAITVKDGTGEKLWLFACVSGAQPVRYATLDADGKLSAWKQVPGQPALLRARDVSLAPRGTDLLLLLRDSSPGGGGQVYLTRHASGAWSGSFSPLTAEGAPLRSTVTPAAAAGPGGRMYLVTGDPQPPAGTGPSGRLHLYSNSGSGLPLKWEDEELAGLRFEDDVISEEHVPWSRPAMLFVPHLNGRGAPLPGGRGYLALWYSRGTRMRYLWTWGRLDNNRADFTLGRWHHYEAYGYTDAVAGSGPALVLRRSNSLAAIISQSDLEPSKVRHIPHADGIPGEQVTFRDYDDRPVLRGGLCPSLNWDCPKRCKRLTDSCGGSSEMQQPPELQCILPRWEPSTDGR
jgi:hypothetical protein